jgi:hypothetical protein
MIFFRVPAGICHPFGVLFWEKRFLLSKYHPFGIRPPPQQSSSGQNKMSHLRRSVCELIAYYQNSALIGRKKHQPIFNMKKVDKTCISGTQLNVKTKTLRCALTRSIGRGNMFSLILYQYYTTLIKIL